MSRFTQADSDLSRQLGIVFSEQDIHDKVGEPSYTSAGAGGLARMQAHGKIARRSRDTTSMAWGDGVDGLSAIQPAPAQCQHAGKDEHDAAPTRHA
jgi:hypothetical protein